MDDLFDNFEKEANVNEEMIKKFKELLPEELIEVWIKYGFGSVLNGYLKIINPDEYQDVINSSYFRSSVAIPIFCTAYGDIITWEEKRYLRMIKYNKGTFIGIL